MFQAQYLPAGVAVYSPWFERKGDLIIASAEMIAISGGLTLTIQVFTKNKSDSTDGAVATATSGDISLTGVGRQSKEYSGLEELVRYKMSTSSGTWTMFRLLPPAWFDAVKV